MALLLKNGIIFLHVPKTGGNWITHVLNKMDIIEAEIGHKHSDLAQLFFELRVDCRWPTLRRVEEGKKPFLFCFVRNPLSWYQSWFKYMSQPNRAWRNWGNASDERDWHPCSLLNGVRGDNFSEFLMRVAETRPGYATELFSWFDRPSMNFVGRYENLRDDLLYVLDATGAKFDRRIIKKTKPIGVSPYKDVTYSKKMLKLITKFESVSMTRYGYSSNNFIS